MNTRYRSTRRRTSVARWMDLRYPGVCAECQTALPAGSRAFYDPAWADPKPPTLRMTPGETAAWLGIQISE